MSLYKLLKLSDFQRVGQEIQRACVGIVRGSMGCPALNIPGGEPLEFFGPFWGNAGHPMPKRTEKWS